jgi:hypothetical protein
LTVMPFGGLATIGLATAAPKLIASIKQGIQASKVKRQDTTPEAFKEKMALDRQAAATGRLPGLGVQQGRLGMVQSGALQSARLGAASGSDFLAAAQAADARRQMSEQQLGLQGLQYMEGSRRQLGVDLNQQAGYQQRDLDTYNRTKAALTQSSAENAANAINGLASYGAAGINRGDNLATAAASRAIGTPSLGAGLIAPLGINSTAAAGDIDLSALPDIPPVPGINNLQKPRRYRPGLSNSYQGLGISRPY